MTNADIREAHRIITNAGSVMTREQIDLLRSVLPPLPKQKTLEEIIDHIYDAWIVASGDEWSGNEYDPDISLEDWLIELHTQLKGLTSAKPSHPEFLETEADYQNAPEGTIVVADGGMPCHKFQSTWSSVSFVVIKGDRGMSRTRRRVLRWGEINE